MIGWFLGEAMVYTAAWYETPETTLEHAHFVARAAREFGAKTRGVTLAREQVTFGNERIKK